MPGGNYLFAVSNIERNHRTPLSLVRARVELPNPIGDNVARIRYRDGITGRNFGLYGITDQETVVIGIPETGGSVILDKDAVKPYEPLGTAGMIILPDGRMYVEEDLLMRGASDKEVLRTVKRLAPGLYSEMLIRA